ncbi:MAG: glycosyltransferase family 4 protein [Planctomycetales bacterium]|nr:glycosyltransferase family 4 protein [Planctomycetales bacterium]
MSLRLALVTRRFWPLVGGAEMAMANLAAEFRRQGHSVRIVTGRWEKHWPLEMVHREVPVTRLPHPRARAWGTLRYMYALSTWLNREKQNLDAVLVSMLKHDAYCAVGALQNAEVPVILRGEGAGPGGDCVWQQTARFGMRIRKRCQSASAFVAPSDAIAAELREAGYAAERIVRIDNGVAIPPPPGPATRDAARTALGEANHDLRLEPNAPLVVYTGRLHSDKGLLDLVNAWRPIAERWPSARLWLVGEGPQREDLFRRISDIDLKYRICLPGAFDDTEDVLQAADMFVLPSYSEGMSLSLLEAMGAGIPVVASDIPGNRALVTHEQSGLLVPPRDIRDLSQSIIRLLEQPALRISLGSRARREVREKYSLEKMGREHLDLIERLLP